MVLTFFLSFTDPEDEMTKHLGSLLGKEENQSNYTNNNNIILNVGHNNVHNRCLHYYKKYFQNAHNIFLTNGA